MVNQHPVDQICSHSQMLILHVTVYILDEVNRIFVYWFFVSSVKCSSLTVQPKSRMASKSSYNYKRFQGEMLTPYFRGDHSDSEGESTSKDSATDHELIIDFRKPLEEVLRTICSHHGKLIMAFPPGSSVKVISNAYIVLILYVCACDRLNLLTMKEKILLRYISVNILYS